MRRLTYQLQAVNTRLELGQRTQVMGVVNITPDSFSNDGRLNVSGSLEAHVRYAMRLIDFGADILDIGGESTRPGAKPVAEKEEIRRIIPLIKALAQKTPTPISVDTYKINVAHQALDAGAAIVNNVQATNASVKLLRLVRDYNAAIVLMHMRGTPQTMQSKCQYKDVVKDVISELRIVMEKCLENGIKKDKIIIDPGIGFAKDAQHNLEIIDRLHEFNALKCPILIGTSRKSFIGKVLNKNPKDRLMGTAASCAVAMYNGAHIVRVHDVKPHKEIANLTDAILSVSV